MGCAGVCAGVLVITGVRGCGWVGVRRYAEGGCAGVCGCVQMCAG